MVKKVVLVMAVIVGFCLVMTVQTTKAGSSTAPKFSGELVLGAYGGPGFQVSGVLTNLASNWPFDIRFGASHASVEPGKAADARRIFINDATNGIPEKNGSIWSLGFDLMAPIKLPVFANAKVFGGPRYSMFRANFKYVGGNEDFDVTSKQWGIGGGLENRFPINSQLDLVLTGGVDYFFKSRLYGHDTSYSPDGQDVNPRDDYSYNDADDAIEQPKYQIQIMFGVGYHF